MGIRLTASVAGVAAMAASVYGQVIGGPIVNPQNGHSYYLLASAPWTASQATAVTLGGNLVTINDQAEQDWVFETFGLFDGVNRNLWIGFNDLATEGVFEWVSGEAVTFTNWNAGEPSNNLQGMPETFTHMWAPNETLFGRVPGRWNDIIDDPSPFAQTVQLHSEFFGVVEVVPAPSTLCATALYAAVHVRRRRRA